jgi:hypothetical protein
MRDPCPVLEWGPGFVCPYEAADYFRSRNALGFLVKRIEDVMLEHRLILEDPQRMAIRSVRLPLQKQPL